MDLLIQPQGLPARPRRTAAAKAALAVLMPGFLSLTSGCLGASAIPAEIAGQWQGESRIIMNWCDRESLWFSLSIDRDGQVAGEVGDATVVSGQVRRNNWFVILLGNPEYIIEAELEDPIVEAESIARESIRLIVDLEDGRLAGGFRTNGTKFGGRESMTMTGVDVDLFRSEEEE